MLISYNMDPYVRCGNIAPLHVICGFSICNVVRELGPTPGSANNEAKRIPGMRLFCSLNTSHVLSEEECNAPDVSDWLLTIGLPLIPEAG